MYMKKIVIIISLFFIVSCTSKKEEIINDIKINKDNYIIVDVRSYNEYLEGHIVDSINIPVDTIDENVSLDKDKTIVVYCRSGNRSKTAYNYLKELGYKVIDLGAYSNIDLDKE